MNKHNKASQHRFLRSAYSADREQAFWLIVNT